MIFDNMPALPIIIPLICAAICAIFRKGAISWCVATSAVAISFILSLQIAMQVFGADAAILNYSMGGHEPPIGIGYQIDKLNSFMLLLVSFMGIVMMPYAKRSVEAEVTIGKQSLFYSMFLLCFSGLMGIVATNDIFNIYVFLEISSLATYTLIAMGGDRRSLTASFEYLILGTLGATFILIGIGLLYMMTGTLNITDMAMRLPDALDRRPVEAAIAFLTLGVALKAAAFPMHIWLTNAYAYAPSFISAFLSSTAAKVSIYLGVRLFYSLFGFETSFEQLPLSVILITLAVAGIFVCSLTAIYQKNVKRLLAFSSVAQLSYILLGIGIATEAGLAASMTHIANHAISKGALFMAVGAIFMQVHGARIEDFKGIAQQMPITMAVFVIGGLSLIGVPGTAGFISKWYFIQALMEREWWPLVILLLVSSLVALIYIWQVIEVAYFRERPKSARQAKEAPLLMLIPMLFIAGSNIYFGIFTEYTAGYAGDVAAYLFSGGL